MIRFEMAEWLGSQILLMMVTVSIGLLVGRIKFGKLTLGTSGTLFVGIFFSWGIYKIMQETMQKGEGTKEFAWAEKLLSQGIISIEFFNLFLILFVAAVGLLASKDMAAVMRKYGLRFIALGILVTFIGAATTYAFTIISEDNNPYEIAGVYTGALTSSPGLGAAIESASSHARNLVDNYEALSDQKKVEIAKTVDPTAWKGIAESGELTDTQKDFFVADAEANVGAGHAIGYPFGVIVVIFAINLIPKFFRMNVDNEKKRFDTEMEVLRQGEKTRRHLEEKPFDIMSFSTVCLIGYTVGSIEIYLGPLGYFGLGSTGGVLLTALAIGYVGKLGPFYFRMETKVLSVIQNMALAFFLGIVGLKYGYKVIEIIMGPGAYLAFVSLVVAMVSIITAFVVGRYILKLNWVMLSGAICGGMTSTPGLGSAIESLKSDDPATGYGATYPFALLGMVMFSIILHTLPM